MTTTITENKNKPEAPVMDFAEAEKYFSTRRDLFGYFVDLYEKRFRKQGLSQRKFCEHAGVNRGTFSWWKHVLTVKPIAKTQIDAAKPDNNGISSKKESIKAPAFVRLTAMSENQSVSGTKRKHSGRLEIILKNSGHVLRVSENFDPVSLLRIILGLEGTC